MRREVIEDEIEMANYPPTPVKTWWSGCPERRHGPFCESMEAAQTDADNHNAQHHEIAKKPTIAKEPSWLRKFFTASLTIWTEPV